MSVQDPQQGANLDAQAGFFVNFSLKRFYK
jgi:hypothetical protein